MERERLHRLLGKYSAAIIFVGHNHCYYRSKHNGILHITTGGGGAPLYAPEEKLMGR